MSIGDEGKEAEAHWETTTPDLTTIHESGCRQICGQYWLLCMQLRIVRDQGEHLGPTDGTSGWPYWELSDDCDVSTTFWSWSTDFFGVRTFKNLYILPRLLVDLRPSGTGSSTRFDHGLARGVEIILLESRLSAATQKAIG